MILSVDVPFILFEAFVSLTLIMPPEPEDFDITEFLFVVKATSALLTLKFPPMFPVVFAVTSESTLTLEPLTSKLNPNPLKSLFAVAL